MSNSDTKISSDDGLSDAERRQATAKLRIVQEWQQWLERRPGLQSVTQATTHFLEHLNRTRPEGDRIRCVATLYNWQRKFKAHGLAGLADRRRDNRPPPNRGGRRRRDAEARA